MIILYTTKTCQWCKVVKKYLAMKQVKFEVVDVTDDQEERQRLYQLTNAMTVPITTYGEKFVIGWNPEALNRLIRA